MNRTRPTAWLLALLVLSAALVLTGCGEKDPGAIGPTGVDGGLSSEGQAQEYVDGVGRALEQLGAAQGPGFGKAIDSGNGKQLQEAAISWRQGVEQLRGLNPPKEAVGPHKQLVGAVTELGKWNDRIAKAAPNKAVTRRLAKQASASPASRQFEAAVCGINDAGFGVVDPGACTPLADAEGPAG